MGTMGEPCMERNSQADEHNIQVGAGGREHLGEDSGEEVQRKTV